MNTRSQAGNYSSGGILVAFVVLYDQNRPDPALLGTYCWIHISQVNISSFDFLHDDNILTAIQNYSFVLQTSYLMYKTRICILALILTLFIVSST